MLNKKQIQTLILILPFLFSLLFLTQLKAKTETVSISVKLSVCGDGIVEGNEDCEGKELNNTTCRSLGFQGGRLTCDPACSFNTFLCVPFPEPEPDTETTRDEISEDPQDSRPLSPGTEEFRDAKKAQALNRRQYLEVFDTNNDSILTADEIPSIVVTWINAWTVSQESEVCDLNGDKKCDIYDFSILLYHIDNKDI